MCPPRHNCRAIAADVRKEAAENAKLNANANANAIEPPSRRERQEDTEKRLNRYISHLKTEHLSNYSVAQVEAFGVTKM